MTLRAVVPWLALLAAPAALAQDAHTVRALAATCNTCHGTDGRSVGGVPPSIAGRPKAELHQMLMDFKSGKRPATIMHQQARGYTDAQLEQIAGYFAGVPASAASAAPAPSGY
jgi:cytochrome c553